MNDIWSLFDKIKKTEKVSGPPEYIIVGLGNPGKKYHFTRHNAGFLMMDYLSQRCGVSVDRVKFKALVGEATIEGKRVLLMKPQTFMNASGEAVQEATAFYKIPMKNVLVLSDDVSLSVGRVRVRRKGSDGGQRGLRSIITLMNTDDFPRIRFGVGEKPHPDYELADWVLSEFNEPEKKQLFSAFETAYDGVLKVLNGDLDGAMQTCNGK